MSFFRLDRPAGRRPSWSTLPCWVTGRKTTFVTVAPCPEDDIRERRGLTRAGGKTTFEVVDWLLSGLEDDLPSRRCPARAGGGRPLGGCRLPGQAGQFG